MVVKIEAISQLYTKGMGPMSKKNLHHKILCTSIAGAISQLCTYSAVAAENEYSIQGSVQHQILENPRRTNLGVPTTSFEEKLWQYQIDTSLARSSSRFNTDLNYIFTKLDYDKDLLNDRNLVTGSSSFSWTPIQDTFRWDLQNSRRQQVIDATVPTTQNNLQVSDVTSTGPTLNLRLGAKTRALLSHDYAKASTQSLNFADQIRNSTTADLQRLISQNWTAGISLSEFRAKLDSPLITELDRRIIALRNQYNTPKYQVNLGLGYIDSTQLSNSEYQEFSVTYLPTEQTTLRFGYNKTVQDQFGDLLGNGLNAGLSNFSFTPSQSSRLSTVTPFNNSSIINSGGTALGANLIGQYELSSYTFMLAQQFPDLFNYSFEYSKRDRSFTTSNQQLSEDRFGLQIGFILSNRIQISGYGRDIDLDFISNARTQKRQEYGVNASWRLNAKMGLQASYQHSKQSGNLALDSYNSNSVAVTFTYLLASNR